VTTRREIRRHYEREVSKYASPFNHEVMIYGLVSWIVIYFLFQFLRVIL
jgi:hypothetical protein